MSNEGFQLGKFFKGFRDKAAEVVSQQEASFVLGKVAGKAVTADDGTVIIDIGRTVTHETVALAQEAGKLHALAGAVATAVAQDAKEKSRNILETPQETRERESMDSVDEFVEAQAYLGRTMISSVTDIRGNAIVAEGTVLREEDIRRAREAGQIGALLVVAKTSPARKAPSHFAGDTTRVAPTARMMTESASSEDDIPMAVSPLLPDPDERTAAFEANMDWPELNPTHNDPPPVYIPPAAPETTSRRSLPVMPPPIED
jgi:hypothetical protein